jgi:hypothetical protein
MRPEALVTILLYFAVLTLLSSVVGTLQKDPSLACWGWDHLAYIVASVVAIGAYYPMVAPLSPPMFLPCPQASFFFPNMQFVEKALDIKFDTTFLIFVAQGKLLLATLSAFFADTPMLVLVGSVSLNFAFGVCSIWLKPCLVARINEWRGASYLAGSWASLAGIAVLQEVPTFTALALLLGGWGAILALATAHHYFSYGCCGRGAAAKRLRARKRREKREDGDDDSFDDESNNNDDDDGSSSRHSVDVGSDDELIDVYKQPDDALLRDGAANNGKDDPSQANVAENKAKLALELAKRRIRNNGVGPKSAWT